MAEFREIADALKSGRAPVGKKLVQEALDEGKAPEDIIFQGLVVGMGEIGIAFKNNEIYVPEVLIAARAMNAGLTLVKPLLQDQENTSLGTIAIGTVQGDLHDIGKNLVAMMLEGAGFTVIDLGIDVSPEKFLDAAVHQGADVLAISALLTTTMPGMRETVEACEAAGIRDKVKIIVGGAPITPAFAEKIGADGYSADAASAVDLVKELLNVV